MGSLRGKPVSQPQAQGGQPRIQASSRQAPAGETGGGWQVCAKKNGRWSAARAAQKLGEEVWLQQRAREKHEAEQAKARAAAATFLQLRWRWLSRPGRPHVQRVRAEAGQADESNGEPSQGRVGGDEGGPLLPGDAAPDPPPGRLGDDEGLRAVHEESGIQCVAFATVEPSVLAAARQELEAASAVVEAAQLEAEAEEELQNLQAAAAVAFSRSVKEKESNEWRYGRAVQIAHCAVAQVPGAGR